MTSQAGQAGEHAENLSDVELLASALADAVDAHRQGVIGGPGVDEVALRRAVYRAVRADVRRSVLLGLVSDDKGGAA